MDVRTKCSCNRELSVRLHDVICLALQAQAATEAEVAAANAAAELTTAQAREAHANLNNANEQLAAEKSRYEAASASLA